jgi:hypothetical protein
MQKNYLSNEKNDISSIHQVGGRIALRLIDPMGHYREPGPKQRGIPVAQKDNNKMRRNLWRRVHIAYPLKKEKRKSPNQRLLGIDRRTRAKSSMLSTPESLRGIPCRTPCPLPLAPGVGGSWRSSATLLRTAPALVGCGVVLRGALPTLLMRPNRVSPLSGVIQSIEMPPAVLLLPWPLEPPLA